MKNLIREIHRRSLWQVLGVYVVGSYVGYEAILAITDGVGLPSWVPPLAIVLFIIGLPVVLATAIVQQGHPLQPERGGRLDGLERAEDTVRAQGSGAGAGAASAATRAPGDAAAAPSSPGPSARHVLTWNRAITAGVLAFALLGLAATGFLGMRALGIGPAATLVSSGELEARSPLVVADFEALSGDSSLAAVVTEGLRADLAQSTFVTVADRSRIEETLGRMMREPDARLDPGTAREVATRMGLKAVIEGEVGRAGAGYILTSRVVTADSGRTLATFRETASDSTELVPAIEALSHGLRERVGESLRTVRASAPLTDVTTSSLPALRLAVEASGEERAGNRGRAIRLMNQALELDPGFASAWAGLAVFHYNNQERALTLEAIERALEHQDRLDENGRSRVRAFRASIVGDHAGAARAIRDMLARDSLNPGRWINLSDRLWNMGRWDEAADAARRAIEIAPERWVAHWNLVVALVDGGRIDEALEAADAADAALPDVGTPAHLRAMGLAERERLDSIHALYGPDRDNSRYRQGLVDRVRGRWAEAQRHWTDMGAAGAATWFGWSDAMIVLGDDAAADSIAAAADTALAEFPERLVAQMAAALAMAGRTDAARRARAIYEERVPPEVRWADAHWLEAANAFVALHEGRPDDALAGLRRARSLTPWTAPVDAMLGRTYDLLERPDSAIAAYSRYLETPWSERLISVGVLSDAAFRVPAHARLAALHEEAGDMDAAARHAARVVELWSDADAALQPRVAAARRILERAAGEG